VLRLPGREVLVISVYVEGGNEEMLLATLGMLHTQVMTFRKAIGGRTKVIIMVTLIGTISSGEETT
jgi:hypothetical protein